MENIHLWRYIVFILKYHWKCKHVPIDGATLQLPRHLSHFTKHKLPVLCEWEWRSKHTMIFITLWYFCTFFSPEIQSCRIINQNHVNVKPQIYVSKFSPFTPSGGCSAVVARSLCMWKAPGSIHCISIDCF